MNRQSMMMILLILVGALMQLFDLVFVASSSKCERKGVVPYTVKG